MVFEIKMKKLIHNQPETLISLQDLKDCPLWCGFISKKSSEKYLLIREGSNYVFAREGGFDNNSWNYDTNWKRLLEGNKGYGDTFIFDSAREMCEWYLK